MADKESKKSEFVVNDRRLFGMDGELRADVVEAEERAAEREREASEAQKRANEERAAAQQSVGAMQQFLASTEWRDLPAGYLQFLASKLGDAASATRLISLTSRHQELKEKIQQWSSSFDSSDGAEESQELVEGNRELAVVGIVTTLNSFGDVMAVQGNRSDSKEAFELSLKFHSENPSAWGSLALLLFHEHDPKAAEWARKFLSFKPNEGSNSLFKEAFRTSQSPEFIASWAEMTKTMGQIVRESVNDFPADIQDGPTAADHQASSDAYSATTKKMDYRIRKELEKQGQADRAQDFEMNFEKFAASLYMTTLMQLGLAAPQGEKPQLDLLGARQTIDILGMLQEKTKGNLSPVEESTLRNVLYELRMAYLEVTHLIANPPKGAGVLSEN